MPVKKFSRLPRHIGFFPDGNRRWAVAHGLSKEEGYLAGLAPAFQSYKEWMGVNVVSVYGLLFETTFPFKTLPLAGAALKDADPSLSTTSMRG